MFPKGEISEKSKYGERGEEMCLPCFRSASGSTFGSVWVCLLNDHDWNLIDILRAGDLVIAKVVSSIISYN